VCPRIIARKIAKGQSFLERGIMRKVGDALRVRSQVATRTLDGGSLLSEHPLSASTLWVCQFIAKVNQGRVKLAFFVSVSGFTADAEQRLRIQASNINMPLIVPIEGADLKEMLLKREYFEEFFKRKIREIKYLRKY
jgi:hypothetical protein